MPLTGTRSDRTLAAMMEAFAAIGFSGETAFPRSRGRLAEERLAWEYWASSLLARWSETRREKAKKAAIAGGVLPNYTAEPLAIGTEEVIYRGSMVTIDVRVVSQAAQVDVPGLVADLRLAGVAAPVLRKLLRKHTRLFAGAHHFSPTVKF